MLGNTVIDLAAAAPLVFEEQEGARWDLLDVLRGAPDGTGLDGASEIAAAVLDQLGVADAGDLAALGRASSGALSIGGAEMLLPLDEVRLLAPLPRPPSLRDFYAFEEHVAASYRLRGRPVPVNWYSFPVFYFGNHAAIYGPGDDILMPRTRRLDYELEIACVIGRAGRDIPEEDAEEYIAGFTIMNDWSARDIQQEEMSVGLGPAKGKDFATSLGPWLVTPDELEPYALSDGRYDLEMTAAVNGVQRSHGNLRDIYYTFAQLIARASQDATLYPGDVLGSGTVGGGCLLELTGGEGPWLYPGDEVELAITGLGTLRNRVV
ncbi:MAG TPA: fumarylacetoacetate hydrolase family protein [Roseiflexaceae bacterium]|nr:fumarylacetoacetate hydrolase family protein [Roseiflexaceae bacterium]